MRANILQKSRNKGAADVSAIEKDIWICMRLKGREALSNGGIRTVRIWKMQPEGLVKLKTRVKALAEFRRWEEGLHESRREKNKEKTICRQRTYATFVDFISAHHEHERQLTSVVTWSKIIIVLSLSNTLQIRLLVFSLFHTHTHTHVQRVMLNSKS